MDRTRAQEIIAAYGGDATRWPEAERESALILIAGDAALGADLEAAMRLDRELSAWAMAPVASGDVAATSAADAALASLPSRRRWLPGVALGGSIAASLLAAVMILPSSTEEAPSASTQIATATPSAALIQTAQVEQDVQLWGTVFTLTPEEESLI